MQIDFLKLKESTELNIIASQNKGTTKDYRRMS